MDSSTQRGQVLDLAGVLAGEGNARRGPRALHCRCCSSIPGAAAVLVFSRTAAGLQLTARAGLELSVEAAQDGWLDPVPADAAAERRRRAGLVADPGHHPGRVARPPGREGRAHLRVDTCGGRACRAGPAPSAPWTRAWPGPGPRRAWPTWRPAWTAPSSWPNMGDYDWHIPSDTNTWSDQLFRIYGYEPQSFHPSYEQVPVADPPRGPGPDQRPAPAGLRHR